MQRDTSLRGSRKYIADCSAIKTSMEIFGFYTGHVSGSKRIKWWSGWHHLFTSRLTADSWNWMIFPFQPFCDSLSMILYCSEVIGNRVHSKSWRNIVLLMISQSLLYSRDNLLNCSLTLREVRTLYPCENLSGTESVIWFQKAL